MKKWRVLKMSLAKVKRIEDPESFLRRSVLINNTIKRLQREVREEKMMRHGGYTSRLSSCSSYRKSFACSRLSDLSVVDDGPVLDDEPGLMEPEGPSPLDSITIDKSHHNSPSIMHNSRKRPLSEESEDDCDVQAVLSQIYIPPTPCIMSSIDDDDNAMHCGSMSSTSTASSINGNSTNCSGSLLNPETDNNPCDSSSVLDSVTFTNCTSMNGSTASSNVSSSLDCSLSNVSSMLISTSSTFSSGSTPTSLSTEYQGPDSKRARLESSSSDDDDEYPTTSLLAGVNDDCAMDEDDVDVDVVGDSEISDWPTPPTTPTSLSLLTSAAACAAVASSAAGMNPLAASLALSYSISACASLAGSSVHHPGMTMSPISAAAAAAAAAMQATSSCLLARNLCANTGNQSKSSDEEEDDDEDVEEDELEVGSSRDDSNQQSCRQTSDNNNVSGASCVLRGVSGGLFFDKDESSNDGCSSDSQSSGEGNNVQFPSIVNSSAWDTVNQLASSPHHHHPFSISSPAFPIFSSSFANTNPTVLSPSNMGNGLMMSPLPMTNTCSIPSFVTPSLPLPTSCDVDDDEEDDEQTEENRDSESQSVETKENNESTPGLSSCENQSCDILTATPVDEDTTSLLSSCSQSQPEPDDEEQEALKDIDQFAKSIDEISSQITFIPSELQSSATSSIDCVNTVMGCSKSCETSEVTSDMASQQVSSDSNEGCADNSCNNDTNTENNNNHSPNSSSSSSSSSTSSGPSSPLDEDKQAQQQQYSSCGHSSIFGELQSVVFHNLIASLES